jgi:hypothetical protein
MQFSKFGRETTWIVAWPHSGGSTEVGPC